MVCSRHVDKSLAVAGGLVGVIAVISGVGSVMTAVIGEPGLMQWLAAGIGTASGIGCLTLVIRHFACRYRRGVGWIISGLILLVLGVLIGQFAFGDWVYQPDAIDLIVSDFGVHAVIFGVALILVSVGLIVDIHRPDLVESGRT